MDIPPSRLGDLILVRLAAKGQPPGQSALGQCLKPYFSDRLNLSDGQWRILLGRTLEELTSEGRVESHPLGLTSTGRQAATTFLQIKSLPRDCAWTTLRNRYLLARALEIRPRTARQWKRLGSADGLRAAVLVHYYQLPIEPLPTLTKAFDALAKQQAPTSASVDTTASPPKAREHILRTTLLPDQPGELKTRLPALVTKARNNSIESLRQAVINHWLERLDAEACRLTPASKPNDFSTDSGGDLQIFAERIQELARQTERGQYGGNKVFLSHLWQQYQREFSSNGITRRQFDEQLLSANRENLITLSRADFTIAMDSRDVEDSEIRLPHATFHFLRTDHPPS